MGVKILQEGSLVKPDQLIVNETILNNVQVLHVIDDQPTVKFWGQQISGWTLCDNGDTDAELTFGKASEEFQ